MPAAQAATAVAAAVVVGAQCVTAGSADASAGAEVVVATEEALEAIKQTVRRVELAQAAQRHGVGWWVCFPETMAGPIPERTVGLRSLCGTGVAGVPRPAGGTASGRPGGLAAGAAAVGGAGQLQRASLPGRAGGSSGTGGANIQFDYLPPYSLKLNRIEGVWRTVKYTDLTRRSYDDLGEHQAGVQDALRSRAEIIRENHASKMSQNLPADP